MPVPAHAGMAADDTRTAMTQTINRQVLLAKRPEGTPKPGDFRIIDGLTPAAGTGELLLRTCCRTCVPASRAT